MTTKFIQLVLLSTLIGLIASQSCSAGNYLAANNVCQACSTNCAACSSANYCQGCSGNNFLVVSSISVSCKPCAQVQIGCSICLTNFACQTCQFGFILQNNTCASCSTSISNCSNCSSDGATCDQCRYPYILVSNRCISSTVDKIINGMQTVYVNTTNGTIVAYVALDSGLTVPATLSPQGCNQYQIFWNNKCIRLISQCISYQTGLLCNSCFPGFIRTIYGDCAVKAYVRQCENGFWLDAAKDVCIKVDQSCDWFFPNNGSCFNCSTNYVKDSTGKCVPNQVCTSRQFFSAGKCISVPLACLTFLPDGICTGCTPGHTIVSGICTPSIVVVRAWNDCVVPCSTCFVGQLSYCFSCSFGYQLKGHRYGTCEPILY